MRYPTHIPPIVLPRSWRLRVCLPLLAVGAVSYAFASAPTLTFVYTPMTTFASAPVPIFTPASAPVMQEPSAAEILIVDADDKGGREGNGDGVADNYPGNYPEAANNGNVGQAGHAPHAEKAVYPRWQRQLWNTPGEIRAWQRQRKWHKEGAWPGNADWKGAQAEDWEAERRTWPERGGYRGRMIGHTDFHRFFGEANPFRLWLEPKVKDGYPQFSHAGNRFRMVDPYPEHWSPSWFRGKQVHVKYDNGYYLHNRKHPEFPIAVMVVY